VSEQQPETDSALLQVKGLETHFPIKKGLLRRQVGSVKAVDGVTFDISRGKTLGLVGESGCGKTTVGRSLLRLVEPTGGEVLFDNHSVRKENARGLRSLRRRMQIVFQDPYGSLNPRMKIRSILEEGLVLHQMGEESSRLEQMKQALERTGLSPAVLERYPHEFSGGQRQRIAMARALVLKPEFLVLDEPVSALDVSIQAQVINLLKELKQELGLTYLFISHDLSVVEYLADNVAVMYLGQIVESAEVGQLCQQPLHPYTLALFSAVPSVEVKNRRQRIVLTGDVPSPSRPPAGCRFHPRCPLAETVCREVEPPQVDLAGPRFHCQVASRELERCGGDAAKTSLKMQAAITAATSDSTEPYSAV
jgi:oligopeptide/dipeptide ABC transporter ATP-binding protein